MRILRCRPARSIRGAPRSLLFPRSQSHLAKVVLLLHRVFGILVDELRDDAGPAGLVRGAEAFAGVPVEVLGEDDEVAPVRIRVELVAPAVHRAAAVGAARE